MIESSPAVGLEATPLRLTWHDRIPVGALTLMAGAPGIGKSSLTALLCADLTKAGHRVILSNCEDDPASVTLPRLIVAGAILKRVELIDPDHAPVFPRDLGETEDLIRSSSASVLILDPVGGHFRPERLVHDRVTLRQLVRVARANRVAVIAIHHTTKTGEVGGPNAGLIGTARAVYRYGYDPTNEDRRSLTCLKVNGVETPPSLVLEHEMAEYESREGLVIEADRLRIFCESNRRSVQRRPWRRDQKREADVHEWLSLFLAGYPDCAVRSSEVRRISKSKGYGWELVRRCKTNLAVEAYRLGGVAEKGWWMWRLPDVHPLREWYEEGASCPVPQELPF